MRKRNVKPEPAPKDPSKIADDDLDAAYWAFRRKAKSWPKARRQAAHAKWSEAFERRRTNALRGMCNLFGFWRACPGKVCGRNTSCSGDARACFDRFWPLVPERVKVEFRVTLKAAHAGGSPEEVKRKIREELARFDEIAAMKERASRESPRPAQRGEGAERMRGG